MSSNSSPALMSTMLRQSSVSDTTPVFFIPVPASHIESGYFNDHSAQRRPISLHESSQTGRSAFRLAPLIASRARAMYGPTTGMFPTKPAIVAKKSPKSTNMPYSSMMKPMKAQRMRIRLIPATKASVPFHFCLRAKKATVFVVPIMKVRPIRKRI